MRFVYLLGLMVGGLYLLNPTAGLFELIPDNLPVIGNLDEVAAMALFAGCWRSLQRLRAATRVSPGTPHND